jgi:hypothetical protein
MESTKVNKMDPSGSRRTRYLAVLFIVITGIALFYALLFGGYALVVPLSCSVLGLLISLCGNSGRVIRVSCILVLAGTLAACIWWAVRDLQWKRRADLALTLHYHDVELVKKKIAEGYDVNAKTDGYTMLTLACDVHFHDGYTLFPRKYVYKKRGELTLKMLRTLLDNGASASINILDEYRGMAPLHYMVIGGGVNKENQIRIVELLISYGADVNLPDRDGNQPLHLAMHYLTPLQIVNILLDRGANFNAKNLHGKTALQIALESGENEKAGLLRAHGSTKE